MHDLRDKTAVVTGAAHGIGAGIARELLLRGARVAVVDRDESALLAGFADQPAAVPIVADFGLPEAESIGEKVLEAAGPPSLIVNNVGADTPGSFLETPREDWEKAFAVNLRAPWFFTRRLVGELLSRGDTGSVVFISSLHQHRVRMRPHYSASKAAVGMLVRELARELGPYGIRVNAVSPGVVRTASVPEPDDTPEGRAKLARLVPLNRIGRPDDIAKVVAFLLSDDLAGYVTGANVAVDGGMDTYTWIDEP